MHTKCFLCLNDRQRRKVLILNARVGKLWESLCLNDRPTMLVGSKLKNQHGWVHLPNENRAAKY